MTDHRAQVEDMLAEYRRSRDALASVHRELAAISESATSEDGMVTATVSSQGALTGLVLDDAVYRRYHPRDLARTVVELTKAATAKAARRAGDVIAPVLPTGTDPEALLRGTADLTPAELAPPRPVVDDSFEHVQWLDGGAPR